MINNKPVCWIPVSASTALKINKRIEIPAKPSTSGIIGVDDWAYKKGNTYGTVIVDLITRKVIDLLPYREADTLSKWLKGHPEITVVRRDRSSIYAMGIRNGAPQASQIADRFHLLSQNFVLQHQQFYSLTGNSIMCDFLYILRFG